MDFEEGKVVTHLNHNKSGHTQLARDVFSKKELEKIFKNPRVHTSRGRHVGNQQRGYEEWYDEDERFDSHYGPCCCPCHGPPRYDPHYDPDYSEYY